MYDGIAYGKYLDTSVCRVSIDNVRLKFTYKYMSYDFTRHMPIPELDNICLMLDSLRLFADGINTDWSCKDSFKIGTYWRTCTLSGVGWSFAVLLGRYCYDSSVKLVAPEVVMDFNPNKVPQAVIFSIIGKLNVMALSVSVQRYDVAFDFPLKREDVSLAPDQRHEYKLFRCNGAVTEYLGERSSDGAIKVYDKTMESNLPCAVTRCEITVGGSNPKSLADMFPALFSFSSLQLDTSFSALPFPVQACLLHPDLLSSLCESYTYKTRTKYMNIICSYGNVSLEPNNWNEIDSFVSSVIRSYMLGVIK